MRKALIAIIAAMFGLLLVGNAFASIQQETNIPYYLSTENTYIFVGSADNYTASYPTASHVNFTSFDTTFGGATQSFGIGIASANATISAVTTPNVQFGETAASSGTSVNATFYYTGTTKPQAVVIEDGGTNSTYTLSGSSFDGGFTAQYVSSSSAYTSATAGVYAPSPGSDSGHLDIKDQWHSTTTIVVYYSSTSVTVPVTCTLAESGATTGTFTFSVSSGSAFPTTGSCSSAGSTTNVVVSPSVTLTMTKPSDGGSSYYRFASGGTSVSTTACSSGTCSTWSVTAYYEIETIEHWTVGGAATSFDNGILTFAFTATQQGTPTHFSDGAVPFPGSTFTWPANVFVDYGTSVSYDQYLIGAATNTRWASSTGGNFTSGALTTSGSYTNTMYKQLSQIYSITPDPSLTDWTSGLSAHVTGSVLGVSGGAVCTIDPTSGVTTAATCSGFADYNETTSYPTIMSGSPTNTEWAKGCTGSFIQTTGGNTDSCTYWYELQETISFTAVGASTQFDAGLTTVAYGTAQGVSGEICEITNSVTSPQGCGAALTHGVALIDSGTAITFDRYLIGSGVGIQWQSSTAGNYTSGTLSSGGGTYNVNYYKQLSETYKANPGTPTTFTASITFPIKGDISGNSFIHDMYDKRPRLTRRKHWLFLHELFGL